MVDPTDREIETLENWAIGNVTKFKRLKEESAIELYWMNQVKPEDVGETLRFEYEVSPDAQNVAVEALMLVLGQLVLDDI